ncbi:MAG: calcium/sodium antiporter [Candidatus Omnitrophica bacterium]|nr:calcium/sodium antiporter [Candidatus Omnitrophota bacterium]MBU4589418.1 calcium/sodium antiporter [Candidatus Omnitrophota bacterium]
MLIDILIFILGIAVIIKGADLFTDGAEGIARAFKIPRAVIGITIVSLATTAPEFTVSTISSYMGISGMAVGNALGSCLANIALILAIAAIIRPIKLEQRTIKQDIPFLIFVILVLYVLIMDYRLGTGNGIFLCALLIGFFIAVVLREIKTKKSAVKEKVVDYSIGPDIVKFLIGAIGVVVSAKYAIVPSGVKIAAFLGVPEVVVGLTMVAIGTSLPELFTAIVASFKNMGELAIGNVVGANILNILWVLGFSASLRPLDIDIETRRITVPLVMFITVLMLLFSRTKMTLSKKEGLVFLAIYLAYIFYIFKFAYI